MNFDNMNLMEPILRAVKACGYEEPTPIQQETIPPVLEGRDVLGCAQTGTGKTAAFALPILQRLSLERKQGKEKRNIRALVLTPTRELALQIDENFLSYGKNLPLRPCVIFGGVGQGPQVAQLKRGVDVLVATPGRLNDLIGQGFIALDHIEIFVLDEADRMLDMGFIHDVKKVIALLPKKRQTLLFSATMPAEVEKLALTILSEPVLVKVDPVSSTVDTIEQSLYMVDKANKKLLLADLLKKPEVESALVFTRTKHGADRVVRELSKAGVDSRAIHGDKSQNARQEALAMFKSGKVKVMIATDIAARGIDIAGLSHVINYDLPNEPESYVHRIGRTGRAGHEGAAISFCCIDEMKDLKAIEKLLGRAIPRKECRWPMEVFTETVKQPRGARPTHRGENGPVQAAAPRQRMAQSSASAPRQRTAQSAAVSPNAPRRSEGKREAPAAVGRNSISRSAGQPGRAERPAARMGVKAAQRTEAASQTQKQPRREPMKQMARPEGAAMRATPLERPTAAPQARRPVAVQEKGLETRPSQSAPSYQQYVEKMRKSRSPFSTGQDRR
ncbi:MAG: DEAD/DEAH box helicase [Eubacteriales bacterium]|nr:DEAD/DEAH box helicase [Eubacteriales bacterium]